MIKLMSSSESDKTFIKSFKLKSSENISIIYQDNIKVGVVEHKKYESQIYIAYISVLEQYRMRGIGKEVIEILKEDGLFEIYGDAIPQSLDFWRRLGADFDGEDEFVEDNTCIPFFIM